MSGSAPFSSNSRQCGQVSEPYSTSFTLALGLPIMKPPAGVGLMTIVQSPPLGGATCSHLTGASLVLASPALELQPAIAITATAPARKTEGFIQLLRLITGIGSSASFKTAGGPLLAAIRDASDSRQARNSGSTTSRRPSPSSLGMGRSCGRSVLGSGA